MLFVNSALTARFVLRREVSGAGNPPMIHGVSLFEGGCFWFSPGIRESQKHGEREMKPKLGITVVAFLLAASTGTFAADSTAAQGPQIAGSATGSSPCQPGKMG